MYLHTMCNKQYGHFGFHSCHLLCTHVHVTALQSEINKSHESITATNIMVKTRNKQKIWGELNLVDWPQPA